jgi:hypothetical protein
MFTCITSDGVGILPIRLVRLAVTLIGLAKNCRKLVLQIGSFLNIISFFLPAIW